VPEKDVTARCGRKMSQRDPLPVSGSGAAAGWRAKQDRDGEIWGCEGAEKARMASERFATQVRQRERVLWW